MTQQADHGERRALPARILRLLAPAILVLGLVASLLVLAGWAQETGAKAEETQLIARGAASDINRFLISQLATVRTIAAADPVIDTDLPAMRALFDRVNPESIGFDGQIFWIDKDRMMRVRSGYDGPPLDFSDREWVTHVMETDEPYVSNARLGALNGVPIVVFAVPTHDRNGGHTGVLGAAMRLSDERTAAFSLRTVGGTAVTIIDRVGQVVAAPTQVEAVETVAPAFDYATLRGEGEGVVVGATGPTGEGDRLVGYAAAPAADWLLVVDLPRSVALGDATNRLLGQLALILGFTVLAIVVAVVSSRRVTRALAAQEAALAAEHETAGRLEVLVGELREREELRDAFVGVLSHELRTPATTIYGMAAILARSPDREDRTGMVEDIRDEADRLDRIIEDLLVLSRAERGVLAVGTEPVLVQRVVPSVAADMARRHPGVPLELDVPSSLPPVLGEDGAIRQVLGNLLGNAAKYGGGAPVRLAAHAEVDSVRIVVSDAGPGFPPEDAERLFDLYYRSPGTSRQAAGTGIGLFVVRQLVEAMGGRVVAGTGPEGGAAFTITLQVYGQREDEGRG